MKYDDVTAKLMQVEKVLKKNFNLTPEQLDRIMKGAIETNLNDPNAVANFLKDVMMVSGNKQSLIWEVFYNNLLAGIRTHETNFIMNNINLIGNELARIPATLLEQGLAKIGKRKPELYFEEIIPAYVGLARGVSKGIARGWEVLKTGFDPEEVLDPGKWAHMKMEAWSVHPNPRVRRWAPLINGWGRAMRAMDTLSKGMLYEAQTSGLAFRKAKMDGAKTTEELAQKTADILNNLAEHQDIMENGKNYAKSGTFNQMPDRFAKQLIKIRETKILGITPIKAFIPFISIASNLLRQSLKYYSPAGFVAGADSEAWGQKGYENAAKSFSYVRAALGTMLMLWGAQKFLNGELTLEAPSDPTENNTFYNIQKKIPWSISIDVAGHKNWVSIRKFEPFITPFMNGAIIVRTIQENIRKGEGVPKLITMLAMREGQFVMDAGYLTGMTNFFNAFSGGFSQEKDYERFLGSIISGFTTASFWRDLARWYDPYLKQPKSVDEVWLSTIPIFSKMVPNRLDAFGQPIQKAGSPFIFVQISQEAEDKMSKELVRLGVNIGFVSSSISGVKLTDEQEQEFQRIAGQLTKEYVADFINSPDYDALDDLSKTNYIDKLVSTARETARVMFMDTYVNQDPVKKINEIYNNILPMDDKQQTKYITSLIKTGAVTEDELNQLITMIEQKAPSQKESLQKRIQEAINPAVGAADETTGVESMGTPDLITGTTGTIGITGGTSTYNKYKFPTLAQIKEQNEIGGTSILPPTLQPIKSYDDFALQFQTFNNVLSSMESKINGLETKDIALDKKQKYIDLYNQRLKQTMETRLKLVQQNPALWEQFLDTEEAETWFLKESTKWYKSQGKKVPSNLTLGRSPSSQLKQALTKATPTKITAKGYKTPKVKLTTPKMIKIGKIPSSTVSSKIGLRNSAMPKLAKLSFAKPKMTRYMSSKTSGGQTPKGIRGRRIA